MSPDSTDSSLVGLPSSTRGRSATHDQYTHKILAELESGNRVSQRSLSRDLGIALGLTNLLIRRLVHKGWVRVVRVRPNRVRYLLTPAGLTEKARMSQQALQNSVRFYAEARDRIRERFARLSAEWPDGAGTPESSRDGEKRIVFFGAGEVAEIGYVCLQGNDLRLVGVVDDHATRFFDVPVHTRRALRPGWIDRRPFGRLVIMSFEETERIKAQLAKAGFGSEDVFWL